MELDGSRTGLTIGLHGGLPTRHDQSNVGLRQRLRWARAALTRIGGFLETLRATAEQLTPLERWYRILSEALVKYLKGRQLDPPRRLRAA